MLLLVDVQVVSHAGSDAEIIRQALWAAFFILVIVGGVVAWFFVLAQDSRRVAQENRPARTRCS